MKLPFSDRRPLQIQLLLGSYREAASVHWDSESCNAKSPCHRSWSCHTFRARYVPGAILTTTSQQPFPSYTCSSPLTQYISGAHRSFLRLLANQSGIVSLHDHGPEYQTLPSQVAALVPRGKKEDGGWTASEWVSRDVSTAFVYYHGGRLNEKAG